MTQADQNKIETDLGTNRSDLFLNGKRFLHRRDYPSALRCFQADLETKGQNRALDYRIDLLTNIGNIYAEIGEQDRSQTYYQEVLSLQQESL